MYRMQSGGWPYSKISRDSLKALSLRAAVLRVAVFHAAVFCSKILRSDRNHCLKTGGQRKWRKQSKQEGKHVNG